MQVSCSLPGRLAYASGISQQPCLGSTQQVQPPLCPLYPSVPVWLVATLLCCENEIAGGCKPTHEYEPNHGKTRRIAEGKQRVEQAEQVEKSHRRDVFEKPAPSLHKATPSPQVLVLLLRAFVGIAFSFSLVWSWVGSMLDGHVGKLERFWVGFRSMRFACGTSSCLGRWPSLP